MKDVEMTYKEKNQSHWSSSLTERQYGKMEFVKKNGFALS